MRPPERRLELAAALGLGLVLTVVVAAAGLRLGAGSGALRLVHRVAASLEVIVVLWLGWMAWRIRASRPELFRAALAALLLTAALSVIGILAGQNPPPAGAAANLLGGLALASVFAWIGGALPLLSGYRALTPVFGLLLVQLALGAWLSIVGRWGAALPAHGILALVLAGLLGWLGLARVRGAAGMALFTLAMAAPLAGFTSLHYEYSAGAALVHAAAAALLLAATAYALGRRA